MSDTVVQIGNAAADIVGLPRQATLVGNTNQNAVKILRAVRNAQREVSRDFDWVVLKREHTFTTDGSSSYAMPTYFDRILNGTIWDRTNYCKLTGPVRSNEWQEWKSGITTASSLEKIFRIYSNSTGTKVIELLPSDDSGSEIAFEYVDSRSVKASGGDLKEEITADDDYFVFDDEVVEASTVWRLLRMLGLNYDDEKVEYLKLILERRANDSGSPVLGLQLNDSWGLGPHVPQTGYGS